MVIEKDVAEIILGQWICGQYIQDKKLFRSDDFGELKDVARLIINGETDALEIAKKAKVKIGVISNIISAQQYDALYEVAMSRIMETKFREAIKKRDGMSMADVADLIAKHRRSYLDQFPEPKTLAETAVEYYDELDCRMNGGVLSTGINSLDHLITGVRKGTLVSIGARPSVGKTAFVLQVAVNVARAGGKVLFVSLEMPAEELYERILLRYSRGLSQSVLSTGELTHDQWEEVGNVSLALNEINENLLVCEATNDIDMIRRIIRAKKPDMVVIDQVSHLRADSRFDSVRDRFSYMTQQLKVMAMEEGTSVWMVAQLNRTVRDTGISMDAFKESGSIEEDSDIVILLSREVTRQEEGVRDILVNVAKNRRGQTGTFQMQQQCQRFLFREVSEKTKKMKKSNIGCGL